MKTAASLLQEMMMKLGQIPEYDCVAQSGPQHQALFEYRCKALNAVVTAAARSKKEAKQEAARLMLLELAKQGHNVPPPYGLGAFTAATASQQTSSLPATETRSYVALLKELCEEYRLGAVEYDLVGDTGPPHLRHFTIKARLGNQERLATSTTKKAARQIAAEQLYTYLRENLTRVTNDFVEEDALVRAHEKAMERYLETVDDAAPKIDLGQKISEYHLGLAASLDDEARLQAVEALDATWGQPPDRALTAVIDAAGLTLEWTELGTEPPGGVILVEVSGCSPPLAFGGTSRGEAAGAALRYVRLALRTRTPRA